MRITACPRNKPPACFWGVSASSTFRLSSYLAYPYQGDNAPFFLLDAARMLRGEVIYHDFLS